MQLVERAGRRRLLIGSLLGVVVALVALSVPFAASGTSAVRPTTVPDHAWACSSAGITTCEGCLDALCTFCTGLDADGVTAAWCINSESEDACQMTGMPAYREACPNPYSGVLLGCLMLYLLAFAVGMGPLPWVINSEIYPVDIRGLASGLAGTANWVTNAVVTQLFLILTQSLSTSGTFLLFAVVAGLGAMWSRRFVPETKSLSLADVQALFERRVSRERLLPTAQLEGGDIHTGDAIRAASAQEESDLCDS